MSLINQMLQDLEKRRPGGETAMPSTAQVMAVPKRRRSPLFWPAMLLLVPVAGVLAWLLLRMPSPEKTVISQPVKAVPAPQVAELPPAAPAATPVPTEIATPEMAAASSQSPPVPAPSPLPAHVAGETTLKWSPELAVVPKPADAAATPAPPGQTLIRSSADNAKQKPIAPAPKEPASISQVEAKGKGSLTAASTITKQVKETTPQQQTESEYRKALSLLQQGRVGEAIDGLAQVLQLDARHAAARQTMIGLLVEARRYGEAERRLLEGLALDPSQPELATTLARLQVERGDVRGGLATLERTLPYAAERPAYQAFLAALLQREERHREAIEHYQLATRKTPSGVWLMGLGISLQAENRYQEARQAFNQAKATNSLSPELQAFVEQRLKQLGQ